LHEGRCDKKGIKELSGPHIPAVNKKRKGKRMESNGKESLRARKEEKENSSGNPGALFAGGGFGLNGRNHISRKEDEEQIEIRRRIRNPERPTDIFLQRLLRLAKEPSM